MSGEYQTFSQFYPFYLSGHSTRWCRRLHYAGSLLVIVSLLTFVITRYWPWLIAVPICGYGFAWIGHFFFERNKPATFKYPLYSLMGDWVMFWNILMGKIEV